MEFSVLMSIYFRENPVFFQEALKSIMDQSVRPTEIVIVKDGPLTTELDVVLERVTQSQPDLFKVVSLPTNKGLGNALHVGISHCRCDIIARMDSDDIATRDRFEKQLSYLMSHPEVAVLGSNIEEFNGVPGDLGIVRLMPSSNDEIIKFSKLRNPMNHPSVMYRKSAVLESGSYNPELLYFEDYSLFVKMLNKGFKLHNLPETLLYFRVGNGIETIKRRSGIMYIRHELKFVTYIYNLGHLSNTELLKYLIIRIPVRILPAKVVLLFYNVFLRKKS
ncbi:hypothetical protein DSL64_09620 [Dyadobacter luteus]|uniref:Glycosyltransferase 2-like domain-containing protein n=1 Tax=Dyadobacter luteus TaxID=2259619 RepID=A0A3D8YDA2_9BACT|nr:glycosyltransferase [Dyadobacter luteus]REA62497.1 hypothetical protein DSL64_09620 [Dyadobacter luteus]